ncbi:hypothetical protein B0O80DRAFT_437516 [Mortierella sp. GBAus27b]|nr:hypothetical protein B0O80DRAFT_437516 [Mortierella sp. GBAus27b]
MQELARQGGGKTDSRMKSGKPNALVGGSIAHVYPNRRYIPHGDNRCCTIQMSTLNSAS